MGLANALYNLGTTVVNDSTKDPGTGKQVGLRVYVLSCTVAFSPFSVREQKRSSGILGGARRHGVTSYDTRTDTDTDRH